MGIFLEVNQSHKLKDTKCVILNIKNTYAFIFFIQQM